MLRRTILAFVVVAPIATIVLWRTSILLALGILFASHMLVVIPTLAANLEWLGPVTRRFRTDRREVWLTIDDGPDPDDTGRILDFLDRHGARATFFVKGELVRRRPDLARAIVERGHSIGNHSDTHPSATFWCLPPRAIAREIDRANEAIVEATGRAPRLFRAPVGMKNPFVHPALARRGMILIGWSSRGWDTVLGPEDAAARIVKRISPGTIVLAHQGPGARPAASPARCLEIVVETLSASGWTFLAPEKGRFDL